MERKLRDALTKAATLPLSDAKDKLVQDNSLLFFFLLLASSSLNFMRVQFLTERMAKPELAKRPAIKTETSKVSRPSFSSCLIFSHSSALHTAWLVFISQNLTTMFHSLFDNNHEYPSRNVTAETRKPSLPSFDSITTVIVTVASWTSFQRLESDTVSSFSLCTIRRHFELGIVLTFPKIISCFVMLS